MSDPAAKERLASLVTNGWAGRNQTPVMVVGETPKRWRIRAIQRTKLAGRNRWIEPGETVLVPRRAVIFNAPRFL